MFKKIRKEKASRGEGLGDFTKVSLEELFYKNTDVLLETYTFSNNQVTFISCEGMVDQKLLNESIYEKIIDFFKKYGDITLTRELITKDLYLPNINEIVREGDAVKEVFSGKLLILFHKEQTLFSTDIANRPQRKPEETSTEISIKGPRDDFIEDIFVNIALIRKRLRTNSLVINRYELGSRTQTQVALLYMDDIIDPEIIEDIDQRLREIEIDGIYSGTQLKEILSKRPYNFYPVFHYSGRPDFAVHSLLNGRFVLLIDGVQYVLLAPVNLSFILKSAEDSEATFIFNTFERAIRLTALAIGILLPGLWVALSSYHQNQLPVSFLGTVIESRKSVPLPAPLETLIMVLLFEFFREAGLRMPMAIGSTLSVVGGLIIGDAAIRAGLTSPILIVVIASSSVATYTLVSMSLHGIVSILRIFVIILSSLVGLYGFLIGLFMIILSMANIESFGVSYISVPGKVSIRDILKTFLKLPEGQYKLRPSFLTGKDKDGTKGGKKEDDSS